MKRLILLSLVSFAISFVSGQALQLQHPAKGDVWPAFTSQRIQWQFANVDNIKIEISIDSGRTWSVLQSSYPASATYYDWTVIDKPSDSCFVRISDISNSSIKSSSYPVNPFKIPRPTLTIDPVDAPVYSKTVLPISWTSSGIQTIRLLVSYDNLTSYKVIADNIPAVQQFYNWIVSDITAANCFIIIQSVDNSSIRDTTKQQFPIKQLPLVSLMKYRGGSYDGHSSSSNKAKSLTLLSPNKGEQLVSNTIFPISWSSNEINTVTLKFSRDGGTTWNDIASNIPVSAGSYNWTVTTPFSDRCLVKILNAADESYFDISDSLFAIRSTTIDFTGPVSDEKFYRGQVMPITWNSAGINKVKISYLDGSVWKNVTDAATATNQGFNWIIPNNIPDSVTLKISDFDDILTSDTVSKVFIKTSPSISAIKYRGGSYDGHASTTNATPFLTLIKLNENTSLANGMKYKITWTGTAVAKVDLIFSADSGKTWQNIVTSYPNSQIYEWTIPAIVSSKCLIRIQSSDDASINDISDSVFTILPEYVDLIVDTVATRYFGTAVPLEWTQQGIEKVSLEYKTAKNASWQKINDVDAALEIYNWILPVLPKDSLWISISDHNNTSVKDEQLIAGVFKSLPAISSMKYKGGSFDGHSFRSTNNAITIFKPAANETLISGSTFPITWVPGNVTDTVSLQYSLDSGKTWKTIANAPAINGQYQWIVPSGNAQRGLNVVASRTGSNLLSDKCLIRAVSTNSANEIVGLSSKTFSIQQPVTIGPDYFWVGGTGLWSDYSHHWATTSGGTTFHSQPPSSINNVFFDAHSFNSEGQTITIDVPASCNNMTSAGVTNHPTFISPQAMKLTVFGSLTN